MKLAENEFLSDSMEATEVGASEKVPGGGKYATASTSTCAPRASAVTPKAERVGREEESKYRR